MTDRHPGLKFLAFAVLCSICAAWLISVTGNIRFFARTTAYEAVLDDAMGLVERDSVLLAGVRVGTVRDIDVERGKALVTFDIDRGLVPLETWETGVRWRNVIGQRYLYLYPVTGGEPLEAGARLPVANSRPTADIGRFFERLTPLLRAIDPHQQNILLAALNEAFSGAEDRTRELVDDLGQLTTTLSGREERIRGVISNGRALLDAYARRDQEIRSFLDDFASVSQTLRQRNDELVGAITDIGEVQRLLDDLLTANHDEIRSMVDELADLSTRVGANTGDFEAAVATLREGLGVYMLVSRWGQWFNVRAVATQVQENGRVTFCQTEGGNTCAVPNTPPPDGQASATARYDALRTVTGAALGRGPGDGLRHAATAGGERA